MLTIDTGALPPEALRSGDWRDLASVFAQGARALDSRTGPEAMALRRALEAMRQQSLAIAASAKKNEEGS